MEETLELLQSEISQPELTQMEMLKMILKELKKLSFSEQKTYTTAEVAEIFHTYEDKVNAWRKAGLIKGIKKGRGWIYSSVEIDRFLESVRGKDLSAIY